MEWLWTCSGQLDQTTGGLRLTDIAHHHLAFVIIFLITVPYIKVIGGINHHLKDILEAHKKSIYESEYWILEGLDIVIGASEEISWTGSEYDGYVNLLIQTHPHLYLFYSLFLVKHLYLIEYNFSSPIIIEHSWTVLQLDATFHK